MIREAYLIATGVTVSGLMVPLTWFFRDGNNYLSDIFSGKTDVIEGLVIAVLAMVIADLVVRIDQIKRQLSEILKELRTKQTPRKRSARRMGIGERRNGVIAESARPD